MANEGGITRAAAVLHRVPSGVTTRIQHLEANLGVTLFLREGRRLQLSAQGKVLLAYANRLLALAEEALGALHEAAPRGVLALGAMESTAATRLPALLGALHERHPDLSVELCTGAPGPLAARVLAGELDAALVAEPVADQRLRSVPAYAETLVIVGPAGQGPMRTARDMQGGALLAFEPGCPHRRRLEAWCAAAGVVPTRLIELGSYHAILGCCVAGMGYALLPASVLDMYAERGRLSRHPLEGSAGRLETVLISRRDAVQPKVAAVEQLLAELRDGVNQRGRAAC